MDITWTIVTGQRIVWTTVVFVGLVVGLWLIQSWWIAAFVIVLIVGIVAGLVLSNRRTAPEFTTLDTRYQEAVDESERWLAKWSELFTLNAETEDLPDEERLLVLEAQGAAADAADEASSRRNEYGSRYITNGFDRLDFLMGSHLSAPSVEWETDWRHAVATIERYLETLWIDPQSLDQALIRLQSYRFEGSRSAQRRSELIRLASNVRLFHPASDHSFALAEAGFRVDVAELDAQRYRLRAERALLRDSPLSANGDKPPMR